VSRGSSRELVLKARWIVPMHGPPIAGGRLVLRGGRIAAIGVGRRCPGDLDLHDAIVIPGLVNAHTHLEFSDVDAALDAAGGLPAWLARIVALRRSRNVDAAADQRAAAAIRRGLEESAREGVTALGEIATGIPADGYPASGPRLRVFREALGLAAGSAAAAARVAVRDHARLIAGGVAAGLSPHAPYSVAAPLAARLVGAARRSAAPLAMHVAESEVEAEFLSTGAGPFRDLFEQLGVWPPAGPALLPAAAWITLLARAPRAVVVHGTWLGRDPNAMARLARHRDRLAVAICPRTTLALSRTLPPVRLFREAGVRVAIGTDSRASNPDLSVLAECRTVTAAGLASPAEALRMATIDAAWALGFERSCGILAPGRPADLAILVPADPSADPHAAILDPATRIVATIRAGRVIAGRLPDSCSADATGG
jgi:cytosine/adenosine deaminase-related metal-dependent hydrolase